MLAELTGIRASAGAAGGGGQVRRRRAPETLALPYVFDVFWLLSLCCYRVKFRGRCRVVATQGRRVWLWLLCRTARARRLRRIGRPPPRDDPNAD